MATTAEIIRFLVMARDTGSTLVVSPAGKVVAAEISKPNTSAILSALITARADLRGTVVYTADVPSYADAQTCGDFRIKEIYYLSEGIDMGWTSPLKITGVNLEETIRNAGTTLCLPGHGTVLIKGRGE